MTVVRFNRRRRRRISLRHYIFTDAGPFRLTSRLSRDLAHGAVTAPQFANSVQRMVEVFVETEGAEIKDLQFRATHARFDREGKADLHDAAEAMAVIVDALKPTRVGENVFDVAGKLRAIQRERETQWRIGQPLKKAIMADVTGDAKLPLFRLR
jgi:hypothetical protein